MAEILLVERLVAGHADLARVDDDDEITGVDVRRVLGLVLAPKTQGDFRSQTTQNLVGAVNHVPLALDFVRFGGERFHFSTRDEPASDSSGRPGRGLFPEPEPNP